MNPARPNNPSRIEDPKVRMRSHTPSTRHAVARRLWQRSVLLPFQSRLSHLMVKHRLRNLAWEGVTVATGVSNYAYPLSRHSSEPGTTR